MIFFEVLAIFLLKSSIILAQNIKNKDIDVKVEAQQLIIELTDEKWDQIQKGQWLVGFFDEETQKSKELEDNWQSIANACKDLNINIGAVFAPPNPGLYVRFLVSVFPKVFYIKNGVAHEVPKISQDSLLELIQNKKWNKLKPVNFLSNPFSVQMSLLSHIFIHAVNLYNFENSIVQQFVSTPSATDIVFGLTFIIVGTFLGLLLTCAFDVLQIILSDSKEPEEESENKEDRMSSDEDETKEKETTKKSSSVRKRK